MEGVRFIGSDSSIVGIRPVLVECDLMQRQRVLPAMEGGRYAARNTPSNLL